jgi:hypothetical protein
VSLQIDDLRNDSAKSRVFECGFRSSSLEPVEDCILCYEPELQDGEFPKRFAFLNQMRDNILFSQCSFLSNLSVLPKFYLFATA